MKNKKGFTLIELLAVILILAIIALITVPIVINMIENARRKAAIDTAYGYIQAVEYAIDFSDANIKEYENIKIKDQEYDIEDEDLASIKVKGKKPDSGTITIDKRKVVYADLCISKYEVEYQNNEAKIVKSNKCKGGSGEVVVPDNTPCELATETVDSKEVYYIDSVEDFYAFANSVNSGNNYSGKVVELRNSLDFSEYTPEKKNQICGQTNDGYNPVGTSSRRFSGTFLGNAKTIKNLTINKPNSDNVGIFGYAQGAIIRGLVLDNINVTGQNYVGSLCGNAYESYVQYVEAKNISLTGNNRVSTIAGEGQYSQIRNIVVKNTTLKSNASVGYATIIGGTTSSIIVENAKVNATSIDRSGVTVSNNALYNDSNITYGFNPVSVNDLNYYEAVGLNTWIAGDNDNLGYYWDYKNPKTKVVELKSTKKDPIPTNADTTFEKDGDFYLIKNIDDWKKMSVFVEHGYKFKLENNLDFSGKLFYMMGSYNRPFNGIFDGGAHTIKNVTINNPNQSYLGIFGKAVSGSTTTKTYGLNLENINMTGYKYVGGLLGYGDSSDAFSISVHNINIEATSSGSGNGRSSSIVGELNYAGLSNCLVDKANVKSPSGTYSGYIAINNGNHYVVEHANIDAGAIYSGAVYAISNYVKVNGVEKTDGFDKSKVGDLTYYSSYIDTPVNGDTNGDGYYFDYVKDKDGIYVVKKTTQAGWKLLNAKEPMSDQKWAYFNSDGTKIESGWGRNIKNLYGVEYDYYFENGVAVKGWKTIDGKKYYFYDGDKDTSGAGHGYIDLNKIANETIKINGTNYTFDANGVCTSNNCGS